jgi:hypothetical protein
MPSPPLDLNQLAKTVATGKVTENDLKSAVLAGGQNAGLTELIKGFAKELVSVPVLEKRRFAYAAKINNGYKGPRVLAEGDSWFLYPIKLVDVVEHLSTDLAVWDEALPGDTTRRMRDQIDSVAAQVGFRQPDIFLFSGGGDDLVANEKLAELLEPGPHPDPAGYVGTKARAEIRAVIARVEQIRAAVRAVDPKLPMIVHGYDYAIPQPDGVWLGRPMSKIGVPANVNIRKGIVRALIDEFHSQLRSFAKNHQQVTYVDLRGTIPAGGWFDELHPDTSGFAAVAKKIRKAILKIKPLSG